MKAKLLSARRLNRAHEHRAWLLRYGSWRTVRLSLLLTLILLILGSLLILLRQPHILQGDARWAEVRAVLIPAGLAASMAAGAIVLMLVHATWRLIEWAARVVRLLVGAMWSAVAWLLRALVVRPVSWAAGWLGSALAWISDAVVRPIGRGLWSALRFLGRLAKRVLVHGAWRPIQRIIAAGRVLMRQFVFRPLGWAISRGAAAAAAGFTLLAATLSTVIRITLVRPSAAVGRGLIWLGKRVAQALDWLLGALGLHFVAVGRAAYRLLRMLWVGARRLIGQSVRRVAGPTRALIRLLQTGSRAAHAALLWFGRVVSQSWMRLTTGTDRLRAWHASLGQGQKLGLLFGGTLLGLAIGMEALNWRHPYWRSGDVPDRDLWLLFGPAATLGLVLAFTTLRAVQQPAGLALAELAAMAAYALRHFVRLVAIALTYAVVAPLVLLLRAVANSLLYVVAMLTRLRQWLWRLARLGAPLLLHWLLMLVGWPILRILRLAWRPIHALLRLALRAVWGLLGRTLTGAAQGLTWLLRQFGSGVGWLLGQPRLLARGAAELRPQFRVVGGAALVMLFGAYFAGQGAFATALCRLGVQQQCASPPPPCPAPPGAVGVSFYSSNTKESWINAVTAAFNAQGFRTPSGNPIFVCVTHGTSGGHQQELRDGKIEPTAWSPGDQSWVDGINQLWRDRHGRPLVTEACRATVYAPIGFAMWRPMAEAMGWPDRPIGWQEFVALATDPQGWGRYGHREWGPFKFGHTHPDHSNAGLLILTSLAHDVLEQQDPLTVEQASSPAFVAALRDLEQRTYHYGIQSRDLIDLMIQRGPDFLHATNTTEAETLRTNLRRRSELPQPLAFIFPAGGTHWTEQPFCILQADWVTAEQQEAAGVYRGYLLAHEQQALAPENYLRPVDRSVPLSGPFSLANGTDPRVTPAEVPALESPSDDVSAMIRAAFHRAKKKATIIILLDVSGSMRGPKMANAIEATAGFLRQLDREDEVFIFAFGNAVSEIAPGGTAREAEEQLRDALDALEARGGTALYDAVCQGAERIQALRAAHVAAGEQRLYGLVLLSDGEDTASRAARADMYGCLPAPESGGGIKVFTVMYGDDADRKVLEQVAAQTLGKLFAAEASSIADVYLAISAEQ
jgi:Ca-activated chloride channel homolog